MTPAAFLFGKTPALGDFVSRGLEPADEQAWDAWAAGELEAAEAAHGEAYVIAHGRAPPLRFVAPAADGWRAGAVSPSIDAAGRRYVLIAGVRGLSPATAIAQGMGIAAGAEDVIYGILGEALALDAALDRLERLSPSPADAAAAARLVGEPAAEGAWWSVDSEALAASGAAADGLLTAAIALAAGEAAAAA